jgi:hypothetical protein
MEVGHNRFAGGGEVKYGGAVKMKNKKHKRKENDGTFFL